MTRIVPYTERHAPAIAALCELEGWPTFADVSRVRRLFTAPGVVALVAVTEAAVTEAAVTEQDTVLGAAHALSDGYHAFLNVLIVERDRRGEGIGRQLVAEVFAACDAIRMDLLSSPESEGFYATQPHRRFAGFRIYPPEQ